jgi:hypothetical protein
MIRKPSVIFGLGVLLVVLVATVAAAQTTGHATAKTTIPVKTSISIQPPRWAPKGLVGVTFAGKVSGGPGCTVGRTVGLYQDGYGRLGRFVRTGSWAGHSGGYWTITFSAPGRPFTHFHAIVLQEFRSPSFAKPNRLDCRYASTAPLPPRW